jgi:hypothetical protein
MILKGAESPDPVHAASSYSWTSPPSTSRPWTRTRSRARRPDTTAGRRPETQPAVGPLSVVVGNVGPKHPVQMSAAAHQHPVQALGPDGPDPSFGEGVCSRRLDRREDDLAALACKHGVEAGGILRVAIPDEQPEGSAVGEVNRQVPGLLRHPGSVGVPGGCRQADPPGVQLDYEAHGQGLSQMDPDGEAVGRHDPFGLRSQERSPGRP